MLCGSGDRGFCGERPKWREARAVRQRSVAGVCSPAERVRVAGVVCQRSKKVLCKKLKLRPEMRPKLKSNLKPKQVPKRAFFINK